MAAMSFLFFYLLIILSLSSSALCSSSCSATLLRAAEILSNSDHFSMSLTLKLAAKTLDLRSPTATVFAPSDSTFLRSGQPPLLLLRRHVLPARLSLETLKALSCGTRIPTLLPNQSLIVTASPSLDGFISINDVRINETAVFDGGSIIVYGIDEFFNSSFKTIPKQPGQEYDDESFASAAKFLRSRGYSRIAMFLDAQLFDFNNKNPAKLTIFVPSDQAFVESVRNISDYSAIFRRHVVPRKLSWQDLIGCEFGTKLPTFSQGFEIDVTVVKGIPLLNDARVVLQEIYQSDWLVVHGIHGLIKGFSDQESPAMIVDNSTDNFVRKF